MAFLEWNKTYSVGVAIFDDEHKKLIAILNELHTAIEAGAEAEALQQLSERLAEYALMHLRHEEMYFDDWAYPDAAAHAKRHKELRQKVFAYRKAVAEEDPKVLAQEILEFLRVWLFDHILVEDKAYGVFLASKGLR